MDSFGLDNLDDDCLVNILSFLSAEELNQVMTCSSRVYKARNSPWLDQTRTATLTIRNKISLHEFYDIIASKEWAPQFAVGANRSRLIVKGTENLVYSDEPGVPKCSVKTKLQCVTRLELPITHGRIEFMPLDFCSSPGLYRIIAIAKLLPNLKELDISDHRELLGDAIIKISTASRCKLKCIKWNGAPEAGLLPPGFHLYFTSELLELHVDGSDLTWSGSSCKQSYLWQHCPCLEHLSMKHATYKCKKFSQAVLINLVRRHPTLRWLRSDLTEKNAAMLRLERPEVMLITD